MWAENPIDHRDIGEMECSSGRPKSSNGYADRRVAWTSATLWRVALVVAACGLALWGCGGGSTTRTNGEDDEEGTEEPDVGDSSEDEDAGSVEEADAGVESLDASKADAGAAERSDSGGDAPDAAGGDAGPTESPDAGGADAGPIEPPVKRGDWTYYGTGQGLSENVQDVSADEGGNVYVAASDSLYAKARADGRFLRYDSENAGLTKNCNDIAYAHCSPARAGCAGSPLPKPMYQCRILAVAGASAGTAIIGFEGFGDEIQDWTAWASATGGADVVAFDPERKSLSKRRHVWLASPPHTVCTTPSAFEERAPAGYICEEPDRWWTDGRPLFRKIRRIAVNHNAKSARYGDVWFCGEHAAFAALLNNASVRKLYDRTAGFPDFADAKDTWEHAHPVLYDPGSNFINGSCTALSIAPDGLPWASNQYRTVYLWYPDANLSSEHFRQAPRTVPSCPTGSTWCPPTYYGYDIWPDPWDAARTKGAYSGETFDAVRSLSHCSDGTLWVGSQRHGLARFDPAKGIHTDTGVTAPVLSVACDPLDSSVWIGFAGGGVGRFRGGVLERIDTAGVPGFANREVQSIQIDRWVQGGRRIVYFAFTPRVDSKGKILSGGGVGAYDGP